MTEWKTIEELFNIEKGSLQSSKCIPGEFPFITAAEEWKTHENYTHDCEALIFAMAASGSLGRTHYIKGKFISSDLCFILTPKRGLKLDLLFYYRLLNFLRRDIVKKTATGTSKLSINRANFVAYKLPYFDYDHQIIFRGNIETLATINDDFIVKIHDQLSLISNLRRQVFQEAIEGKLTANWRALHPELISGDNHASKLLERIEAEKERLIKEGLIKEDKSIAPVSNEEKPFELPDGWVWSRLGNIAYGFEYGSSSKSNKEGKVPVLRMGNLQNGTIIWDNLAFTDDQNEINKYMLRPSDILFNRTNSRELVGKTCLYDFDNKAIYAGYIVRFHMCGKLSSNYTNIVMNSDFHRNWCNKVKSDALGQSNINATKLRYYLFPLPSIAEQMVIVKKSRNLLFILEKLEKQVSEREDLSEMLMQSVLREAFAAS